MNPLPLIISNKVTREEKKKRDEQNIWDFEKINFFTKYIWYI